VKITPVFVQLGIFQGRVDGGSWEDSGSSRDLVSMPYRRVGGQRTKMGFWETTRMADQTKENALPLNTSTKLAFDRTRLAHDRTIMAWIRTSTSLITFGFGVYKFFQFEHRKTEPVDAIFGPREFALIMISTGLLCLLLATIQHRRDRNELIALDPEVPRSLAALLAGLIAILGLLALTAVILRH
jgi:putative membrane protein